MQEASVRVLGGIPGFASDWQSIFFKVLLEFFSSSAHLHFFMVMFSPFWRYRVWSIS